MVDISYATLHKRTGEVGWLATLSTPLDQLAPDKITIQNNKINNRKLSRFHASLMSFCPILLSPFDFPQPLPLPALNCLERII